MATKEDLRSTGVLTSEESADLNEETVSFTSSDQNVIIKILNHFCKGCEICAEVCPKDVLCMTVALDRWEGTIVEVVNIDACNACMLCEYQCPDFAIEVTNLKKKKREQASNG